MNKSAGIWLLWLGLTSCTAVHTHKPDGEELVMFQQEFAQYAEDVFSHHSRVMSTLIEGAGS